MEAENVVLLEWGALIPVLIIFAVIFIYKSVYKIRKIKL